MIETRAEILFRTPESNGQSTRDKKRCLVLIVLHSQKDFSVLIIENKDCIGDICLSLKKPKSQTQANQIVILGGGIKCLTV